MTNIDLRVDDYDRIPLYNRILILAGSALTEQTLTNFKDDCRNVGVNYAIITHATEVEGEVIEASPTPRYYAVSKGAVVGLEVGERSGDAIRILSNFGHRPDKQGGLL